MDAVTELMGILDRQTDLVSQLVDNSDASLASKNILQSPNSSFGKQNSGTLSSSEKRKVTLIADIFANEHFKEEKKNQKDTAEKTKIDKVVQPLGQKKDLNIADKLPKAKEGGILSTVMDWVFGFLGIGGIKALLKGDIKGFLMDKYGDVIEPLMGAAKLLKKAIVGTFKLVNKVLFKPLLSLGTKLFKFIKDSPIGQKLTKVFDDVMGFFGKSLDAFKGKIGDFISVILDKIKNLLPKGLADKIPSIKKGADVAKAATAGKAATATAGSTAGKAATTAVGKTAGSTAGKAATSAAEKVAEKGGKGWFKTLVSKGVEGAKGLAGKATGLLGKLGPEGAKEALKKASGTAVKKLGGLSKFAGVLKGVPIAGPLITGIFETIMANQDIQDKKKELDSGDITLDDFQKFAGKTLVESIGGVLGATAGPPVLAALFGAIPPGALAPVGYGLGTLLGDTAGKFLAELVTDYMIPEKYVKSIGAMITGTPMPKEGEQLNDFKVANSVVYPINSKDDFFSTMKGGVVDKAITPLVESYQTKSKLQDDYDKKVNALINGTATVVGGKGFVDGYKLIPIDQMPTKKDDRLSLAQTETMLRKFGILKPGEKWVTSKDFETLDMFNAAVRNAWGNGQGAKEYFANKRAEENKATQVMGPVGPPAPEKKSENLTDEQWASLNKFLGYDPKVEAEQRKEIKKIGRFIDAIHSAWGTTGPPTVPIATPKSVDKFEIKAPKLALQNFVITPPTSENRITSPIRDNTVEKSIDRKEYFNEHMKTISDTNYIMIEYLKNIAHHTAIIANGSKQQPSTKITNPIFSGGGAGNSLHRYDSVLYDNRASYTKSVYSLE